MIAYKLIKERKDGTLGPLFINARLRVPYNQWMPAELHPKKGYKVRKGWHCTAKPVAPHLSMKGRIWIKVEIKDYIELKRPEHQGGLWYLAQEMKVLEKI